MTPALLLLSLWGTQGADTPVHIDPVVGTMRVLCPLLSQQLKVKLECGANTLEDVVGLSIESARPADVMDHIAKTINATWQLQGTTYTLIRTREQEAVDAKRTFEHLESMFVKELTEMKQKVAEEAIFDAKSADALAHKVEINRANRHEDGQWYPQAEAYEHLSPGSRLATRILSLFSPADLASVGTRRRVVYSTDPTKMQLLLRGKMDAALADYYQEQALYADAMGRISPTSETDRITYPGLQSENGKKPEGKVARVNVAFNYPRFGEGLNATVYLINEKGEYLLRATHSFNSNPFAGFGSTLKPEDDNVVLSPISVEFAELIKNFGATGGAATIPKDLSDHLSNPALRDPLSLVIPETLGALGRDRKENVVMHGADFLLTYALRPGSKPGKGSIKHFLSCLGPCNLILKEDKGWIQIEQESPTRLRLEQMNRPAMAEVMASALKQNRFALDDLARYIYKCAPESVSGLAGTYMAMALPKMAGFEILNSQDFLRLYASLSPTQKAALKAQSKFAVTDLSTEQQVIVGDMIFGPNANFTYEYPAPTAAPPPDSAPRADYYNSTMSEPTDLLPTGLTAAVLLAATVQDKDALFAFPKNGGIGRAPRAMEPYAIAYEDVMRERPDLFPQVTQMPVNDLFQMGHQTLWMFNIHVSKVLSLDGQLSDSRLNPGSPMTRKQLPADTLKEIESHSAQIREGFKNMTPEQLGNGKKIKPPR